MPHLLMLIFLSVLPRWFGPFPKYNADIQIRYEIAKLEAKTGKKISDSDRDKILAQVRMELTKRLQILKALNAEISFQKPGLISLKAQIFDEPPEFRKLMFEMEQPEFHLVDQALTKAMNAVVSDPNYKELIERGQKDQIRKLLLDRVLLPKGKYLSFYERPFPVLKNKVPIEPIVLNEPASFSQEDFAKVYATWSDGDYRVAVECTPEGARKMIEITNPKNAGQAQAFVIGNRVVSISKIVRPILGGRFEISGEFSVRESAALAKALKWQSLPVELAIENETYTEYQRK